MIPLSLVALLALGADPSPEFYIPPDCPMRQKPIWARQSTYDKMLAKVNALALPGKVPPGGPSFLYQPAFAEDKIIRLPARPYELQPGDMVFSADGSKFWKIMHNLAGTSHPTHSMIVFALPDGRPALLEGGPHDTLKCRILEVTPHLASYEAEGRVWVRQRSCPLTPMQSARLTEFCLTANCRAFSTRKLAIQLTPFRSRGPFRSAFMGKPRGLDEEAYYCSELVCEALVYAGLLDAGTTRPAATFPRDLFFGDSINLYLHRHLPTMNSSWEPPARWTGSPIDFMSESK